MEAIWCPHILYILWRIVAEHLTGSRQRFQKLTIQINFYSLSCYLIHSTDFICINRYHIKDFRINHMQTCIDSIFIICRANIFLRQPGLNRHIFFRNNEPAIIRMVIRMGEQCHQSTMLLMESNHSVEINIKNGICIQK